MATKKVTKKQANRVFKVAMDWMRESLYAPSGVEIKRDWDGRTVLIFDDGWELAIESCAAIQAAVGDDLFVEPVNGCVLAIYRDDA